MNIAQVGEPILREPAKLVEHFDQDLKNFVDELKQAMDEAGGIGIAAPQVFDPRAVMIVASQANARYPSAPDMAPMVMINPSIDKLDGELVKDWEGCLSVPGLRGIVPRQTYVKVVYQDIDGNPHELEWEGFLARVFLHEYDHLIGKTWLDRVESNQDIVSEQVYLKLMQSD